MHWVVCVWQMIIVTTLPAEDRSADQQQNKEKSQISSREFPSFPRLWQVRNPNWKFKKKNPNKQNKLFSLYSRRSDGTEKVIDTSIHVQVSTFSHLVFPSMSMIYKTNAKRYMKEIHQRWLAGGAYHPETFKSKTLWNKIKLIKKKGGGVKTFWRRVASSPSVGEREREKKKTKKVQHFRAKVVRHTIAVTSCNC